MCAMSLPPHFHCFGIARYRSLSASGLAAKSCACWSPRRGSFASSVVCETRFLLQSDFNDSLLKSLTISAYDACPTCATPIVHCAVALVRRPAADDRLATAAHEQAR